MKIIMTPTGRHIIRVFIALSYIELCAECHSSTDAECKVENGNSNGETVCRYIQWWDETGAFLEHFFGGPKTTLNDGAEISIDWDGEAWVWDLSE